jgi:hypothetical protein
MEKLYFNVLCVDSMYNVYFWLGFISWHNIATSWKVAGLIPDEVIGFFN